MINSEKNYDKLVISLGNEEFRYHLYEVVSLFFKNEDITFVDSAEELEKARDASNEELSTVLYFSVDISFRQNNYFFVLNFQDYNCDLLAESFDTEGSQVYSGDLLNRSRKLLKRSIYTILSNNLGKYFPWGCFTGIRPAKIVNEMLDSGEGKDEILQSLDEKFFIAPTKAKLAYEVAITQAELRKSSNPKSISIYIGIPFCPTRCLYCSFTSNPISRYEVKADLYIDTLIHEMKVVSERVRREGLNIESVYIGGGTPTALNEDRLAHLLDAVSRIWFNISDIPVKEFSVEAGRPDSINEGKLSVLKGHGVTRISINPQTMNDNTLKIIGRQHTTEDFIDAFSLARKMGFNNINTDLIAGLPGEDLEMFRYSLSEILKHKPENLTVHTMSIKKASELRQRLDQFNITTDSNVINDMIDSAYIAAENLDMKPYYLYRQKNMLGNLENTGYSIKGHASLYNIHIMEEDQTILAFGAGAVSKYVTFSEDNRHIERTFNVKGVEEYIQRSDEMIERKLMHPYFI